jgi:hypothetical protein
MTDQPAYVTREEFERRIGELQSEIGGEKRVTAMFLNRPASTAMISPP